MIRPVYRVPGFPSPRSEKYLRALITNGWPEEMVKELRESIPVFESASINVDFKTALLTFSSNPHEAHLPFLETLNLHIKQITNAERLEELHDKASNKEKDSIAACQLLASMEGLGKDKNKGVSRSLTIKLRGT